MARAENELSHTIIPTGRRATATMLAPIVLRHSRLDQMTLAPHPGQVTILLANPRHLDEARARSVQRNR
jgi:hypothetical protein